MRSTTRPLRAGAAALTAVAALAALTGCGAGSRTSSATAAKVDCPVTVPEEATTVDVLAYNSSAIDPFSNTMVKSCTQGNLTVRHEPIDFPGQVQRTTATLSGDTGTYDVLETYGYIIPQLGADQSLKPLDDLYAKYQDQYKLDGLNADMKKALTYDGKLYGIPMQAQMFVMAYRKDVFDELGLEPPTTFAELRDVSQKIADSGKIAHPLALPWNAQGDLATCFQATMNSLGADYVDDATKKPTLDTPQAQKALEEMLSLKPFMDPQVTTFDQPAVQQQMYNGSAAISVMFSGRMSDLSDPKNSQYAEQIAFAPPPTVDGGDVQYNRLSVDGWSIPANAKVTDDDLLFQLIAASVSEAASTSAVPAAYPARDGTTAGAPAGSYIPAADEAIKHVATTVPQPWTAPVSNAVLPIIGDVMVGKTSVADGMAQMQSTAEGVMAKY